MRWPGATATRKTGAAGTPTASLRAMKRTDLERWLRSRGCEPVAGRSRAGHDRWQNPSTGAVSFIPRHREIGTGLGRAICRQLDVPPIPKR